MKYGARALPPPLLNWLVAAAVADWLISRTLTRAAIFVPKPPAVMLAYQVVNLTGQLATSLVGMLALIALIWIAWREWRSCRAAILSLALLGLAGLSLLFLFMVPLGGWIIGYHVLSLAAITLIVSRAQRGVVLLPALTVGLARLYQLTPAVYTAWQLPGPSPLTELFFNGGELFAILSAVGLWWVYGRNAARGDWFMAAVPPMAFASLYFLGPAMAGILAVWSTGLTLYLPWPLYTIGLWLLAVTIIFTLRQGIPVGGAILLLVAGGYAPQLSTHAFLALIALWILGRGVETQGSNREIRTPLPASYTGKQYSLDANTTTTFSNQESLLKT